MGDKTCDTLKTLLDWRIQQSSAIQRKQTLSFINRVFRCIQSFFLSYRIRLLTNKCIDHQNWTLLVKSFQTLLANVATFLAPFAKEAKAVEGHSGCCSLKPSTPMRSVGTQSQMIGVNPFAYLMVNSSVLIFSSWLLLTIN